MDELAGEEIDNIFLDQSSDERTEPNEAAMIRSLPAAEPVAPRCSRGRER